MEVIAETNSWGTPIIASRSKTTGLTVCIAQVDGPSCNGFFTLATEDHSDDGLPHTLEHLIFLGSDIYPYKGVLDQVANRCIAQGTNAWTATDHTAYTVTTASTEGFLNILPIYLDHVLFPTLTDSGYVTEVHHVNGEGDDSGVVYCEMQACENTSECRMERAVLDSLYPSCGYRAETGGIMKNLRESTSHEKVRQYHRDYYRPDNLCLIITGNVTVEEIARAIEPVEAKIRAREALAPLERPWSSVVPAPETGVVKRIAFPSDDTDGGSVAVAWRIGAWSNFLERSAIDAIADYLTDTAVAPLQRDFVQTDNPLCSDVSADTRNYRDVALFFLFSNVPHDKLDAVLPRLFSTLEGIASGAEPIDMARMATVIERSRLKQQQDAEEHPDQLFPAQLIECFLYAQAPIGSGTDFSDFLDEQSRLATLASWSAAQWSALVREQLARYRAVQVVAEPSVSLAQQIQAKEKARLEAQRTALGSDGLEARRAAVEHASKVNDADIPVEVIAAVPVASIEGVSFHTVTPSLITEARLALPFTARFDAIRSEFTKITVLLDTSLVADDTLRDYLPLFSELLFESPVRRGETVLSHEEVVQGLAGDMLAHGARLGFNGRGGPFSVGKFGQSLVCSVKAHASKYSQCIEWLALLLFELVFEPARVLVCASRLVNDACEARRSGMSVCRTLRSQIDVGHASSANSTHVNICRQQEMLASLLRDGPSGAERACESLARLREALFHAPGALSVHVSGDMSKLAAGKPLAPWTEHFAQPFVLASGGSNAAAQPSLSVRTWASHFLDAQSELVPRGRMNIVGLGAIQSSYLMESVPCVRDYGHADVAALKVAIEFMIALEGPLWRQLRGIGLTYSYSMMLCIDQGLLVFFLGRSTHVDKAYAEAQRIFADFISGATPVDPVALEGAISGAMSAEISHETTPLAAAQESLIKRMEQASPSPSEYTRNLLAAMAAVTVADVERIFREYFSRLFDSTHANTAVVVSKRRLGDVAEAMRATCPSFDVTVLDSLDAAFGIETHEEDEDEDEEEDEGDDDDAAEE